MNSAERWINAGLWTLIIFISLKIGGTAGLIVLGLLGFLMAVYMVVTDIEP